MCPQFPLHTLFRPVGVRDTPARRIHLGKFFPSLPFSGRGNEQLGLIIGYLSVGIAPVAKVADEFVRALSVCFFEFSKHWLQLLNIVCVGCYLLCNDDLMSTINDCSVIVSPFPSVAGLEELTFGSVVFVFLSSGSPTSYGELGFQPRFFGPISFSSFCR